MQLYIEFSAKNLCLPIAYRHFVQGMIYDALRADPIFSAAVHNGTLSPEQRTFKFFTFGQLEGPFTVEEKQIHFHDRVSLEIRSINTQLMLLLLNAFPAGKALRLGTNTIYVQKCSFENRVISTNEIVVQSRSPMVAFRTLPDGQTRFFSPEEELFYRLLCANAKRKWEFLHKTQPFPGLSITPVGTVFKKQVTSFKDTLITAWGGHFRLKGTPDLLTTLYNVGLGAKSSQGFGMFDFV